MRMSSPITRSCQGISTKGDIESCFGTNGSSLGPGGLVISQYEETWDNIAGNYLWKEHDIVNIRDYSVDMGVAKTQTFPTDTNVFPGDIGTYHVRITPFVMGSNDEGEGRSVVREPLRNFQMVDLLPRGLNVQSVTLTDGFKASEESGYRIVDNYNGTGRVAIIFEAKTLNGGVFDIAAIKTEVDPDTQEGQVTNEVFLTFDNPSVRKVGVIQAPPGQEADRKHMGKGPDHV